MDPTRRQSGQDQREPAHRQTRVWRWTAPGGWRNCAPQTDHLTSQPGGRSCQTEAAVHSDKRQPSVQPTLRFSFEPAPPRTLLKVRWIPAFTPPAPRSLNEKAPNSARGLFLRYRGTSALRSRGLLVYAFAERDAQPTILSTRQTFRWPAMDFILTTMAEPAWQATALRGSL